MEYKLPFQEYHNALKKNILLGLKCKKCGSITCPPMMACGDCSSYDLEIKELRGSGVIKTYTMINFAPEGRENEVPYIVVLVELEEGPWIMGNFCDIDPSRVTMDLIGKKVKLTGRVFPGDKYSAGPASRPVFLFEG